MLKICLRLAKDALTNTLHDTNCCFNVVFCQFLTTNLSNVNINIGILIFLNMARFQNLVFGQGAPFRINAVFKLCSVQD